MRCVLRHWHWQQAGAQPEVTVVFEAGSKLPLLDCGQDGAAIGCSGRVLAATWGAVRAEASECGR